MSGRSWRGLAAAVAVLGMLISGCSQVIDGRGQYESGLSTVADAKVQISGTDNGDIDRIVGNAIADVQAFWTEQMPAAFGEPYKPVKGFFSVDPSGDKAAPCTNSPSDIRGNAFYCPNQDIVAWDRVGLFPDLKRKFGDFLIAMVIAHEWGHAIQHRTKLPGSKTIIVEAQADCYAGAWAQAAHKAKAPHFEISREILDDALAGYLLFRDPVGASADDRQAHGSGFDRIAAFQEGYEQGVQHCKTFDQRRVFTEVPFLDEDDQQRQGNLPYDDALQLGLKDLPDYWNQTFEKTFQRDFQPVAKVTGYQGDSERPQCDGTPVNAVQYCAADDTIYFDQTDAVKKVYDGTGDFGAMSLLAVAFGQAMRKRLNQTINGEEALDGSICLAGAYAGDVFNRRRSGAAQLSPGDLDEAIQALLNFAGKAGFFDVAGKTGFDRVSAFRKGFGDIRACGG